MLFLLRKIRKELLQENQATRYLIYAIGEIFLVVIGILIALQIDNWNQERNNRAKEITYLENILVDLKNDKTSLIETIERREDKARSAEIMKNYYHGIRIEKLSDYYFHWTNVLYLETHHPRKTTFEELVNSGNFSIIKNAQIKNALLDIDVSYEELFDVERHMLEDNKHYLFTPFSDLIDYAEGIEVWLNPNTTMELSGENVQLALKSQIIKNGFTLAAFNNRGLKELLQNIHDKVDVTISMIEKELGN